MADSKPPAEESVKSTKSPSETKGSSVVARWKGDAGRFISGVPNRDITKDDALSDELLKAALDAGTHERADR